MLAQNLRVTSICNAVDCTFDGKHPCCLCDQIAKCKQPEKQKEFRPEWKKFEFSYTRNTFTFTAPSAFRVACFSDATFLILPQTPPVPPPRFCLIG